MSEGTKTKRPWYVNCLIAFGAFIALMIFIAAVSGGGESTSNSGKDSESDNAQETQEEAIKITATNLYAAYKNNEVAADTAYKGKLIEISGVIDTIGKDILDTPYVALRTGELFSSVQCMLADEAVAEAGTLTPGTSITLRGRGNGYLMNAFLKQCVIVE